MIKICCLQNLEELMERCFYHEAFVWRFSCFLWTRTDKSEDDVERESQLLECRLTLTEERNAVMVPSAGSGIPGAPVQRWVGFTGFLYSTVSMIFVSKQQFQQ